MLFQHVSYLYRCKMLIGSGIYQDSIRFYSSKHQTDRFKWRRVCYQARVVDEIASNAICMPYCRATIEVLQQLHSFVFLRNLCVNNINYFYSKLFKNSTNNIANWM